MRTVFIRRMSGRYIRIGSRRRLWPKCLFCQCFFPAACVYPVGAGGIFPGGRSSGYDEVNDEKLKFLNPEAS